MFYFKQFKSLMSAIMDIDPDAQLITDTIIKFTVPGGTSAVAQYVHHDFDEEGDSVGSVVLMYDGNQTEFDSLRYAEDGIEGLVRQYEAKSGQTEPDGPVEPDDEPELDIATASVDELSSDLVKYLYDNFEEASYIGEKELSDGSLALRIDWGKPDNKKAAANALKDKYGDRIAFISTRAEYAPELDSSGILVYPPKSLQEAADSPADQFELVEDFPIWAIEPMVNDEWGSYLQYNGEELSKQDFYDIDNFMESNGYCGIHAPSDELYEQTYSGFTSRPAFGKGTNTCSVYAVKGEWYPLVQRFGLETSNAVNEADDGSMNEMNGDFESTGFGSSIRALCEKAGKPALAEAVMKLYAVCKPVTESVDDLPQDDWRDEYGEQGIILNESSADGFFAKPNDPIGFAILNNDVASLQKLHDGTYVADEPYNVTGFSEDFDNEGEFHYDFEDGYHREFEEDWERVVGETDNQEALRLMLQYVPGFWLCSIDFWNAFKAGYDKKLLARLLSNYPAKDDPYNNYLPWDNVSFDEVMDFLEN